MRSAVVLKLPLLVLTAVGALVLGACESENAAACQGFVDYHQSLPCAAGADPGVDCNAFADYPCPIDDYFACLQEGYTCSAEGALVVDVVREDAASQTSYTCADLLDCEG